MLFAVTIIKVNKQKIETVLRSRVLKFFISISNFEVFQVNWLCTHAIAKILLCTVALAVCFIYHLFLSFLKSASSVSRPSFFAFLVLLVYLFLWFFFIHTVLRQKVIWIWLSQTPPNCPPLWSTISRWSPVCSLLKLTIKKSARYCSVETYIVGIVELLASSMAWDLLPSLQSKKNIANFSIGNVIGWLLFNKSWKLDYQWAV